MRYTLILFILLAVAQTAFAQNFNEVAMSITPEYPKPGDIIQVSLQSYSQNLQGAKVSWLLDEVLLKEGVGLTKSTITAPLLGEHITLIIKVNNKEQARRTITPATVDILWEAQTYTPKHYKGRALPVDSSTIRAIAIPQLGKAVDTAGLIYNWYKGSTLLTKLSGRGKDTITTDSPGLYDDYNLSVEVTNASGIILSKNGVRITTTEPEILFYASTPILGIDLARAISTNNTSQPSNESTFVALPYYFSITEPQELQYTWSVSNAQYIQDTKPNSITLTTIGTGMSLSATAQHSKILLQSSSMSYRASQQIPTGDTAQQDSYQSPFDSI